MLCQYQKIKLKKYLLVFLSFYCFSNLLVSQDNKLSVNILNYASSNGYWWLENNNFGKRKNDLTISTKLNTISGNSEYLMTTFFEKNGSEYYGAYINEFFIKYNLSNYTYFKIGKYYRDFSQYLNDELSSGSMLISNNARAMKKIGIVSSFEIISHKNINLDFGISHGVFDKNSLYTNAPLLHEKFVYLNILRKNTKISIGLVHEAMWGGNIDGVGKQKSSFNDFLKVFISADEDSQNISSHANAIGNHLGLWEFVFIKKINEKKIKLYYQHFFEDTSGLRFANGVDGLWGAEFENYLPNINLLIEYLDTTNQNSDPPYVDDGYYNHYIYKKGWSYKDFTLGNPFISPFEVIPVAVLHLGIKGKLKSNFNFKVLISRDTNINDNFKYKIDISKSAINNTEYGLFIVNNKVSNWVGLKLFINL